MSLLIGQDADTEGMLILRLSFMELAMVHARCSRRLSFTTLTMGDDLYGVVVSVLKLGPTRLNRGL